MTRLGDIDKVNQNIGAASVKAIQTLHKLIFEFDIVDRKNRKRLREFSGFTIEPDSDDSLRKQKFIAEEFDEAGLITVANILSIDYAGPKNALAERIYLYLCNLDALKKVCSVSDDDDDDDDDDDLGDDDDKKLWKEKKDVKPDVKHVTKKPENEVKAPKKSTGEKDDYKQKQNHDAKEHHDGKQKKTKTRGHEKQTRKTSSRHRRYEDSESETSSGETSIGEDSSDDDSSSDEEDYERRRKSHRRRREKSHKFALTFRDLEDSIRTFNGKDGYSVAKWTDDFEEVAELMEWDQMQRFVYAKKSLTGLAKMFIKGERGITTWRKLKKALKEEFHVETTAAEIHRLLAKRSKKRDESCQEYFLVMREIASRTDLDDKSLMQYVIDGIDDSAGMKIMLYGAKNLKEFKEKLRHFEQAIEKTFSKATRHEKHGKTSRNDGQQRPREPKPSEDGAPVKTSSVTRCYNCGSKDGHKSSECKFKDQGPKCFKCNSFGHIASRCTGKPAKDEAGVNVAARTISNSKMKEVSINGYMVEALLDTGCHLNLVRDDVYVNAGRPSLKSTDIVLTGFGKSKVSPRGYFTTTVEVDDDSFQVDVYVVSEDTLKLPAIIGNDLLDQAEVVMNRSGITVRKVQEAAALMKIDVVREDDLDIGTPTDESVSRIKGLIASYQPMADKTTQVEMNIIMTKEEPVYCRPRRLAPAEKEVVEKQVSEWLENGIVEPSSSDYASPVVVTSKKDGSRRLCIDYRRVNKNVVRDRYPLPVMEDVLDKLCHARVFSTLDLKNGFFHVRVAEPSRKYTAFVTHSGHYQFLRVPFGLCNSPAVFQRHINCVFRELVVEGVVFIYMDDLVIPGQDEQEALQRLERVLSTAQEYGLEIKWTKCQFLKRKIEFLGHIVEDGKISPSPTKVSAVQHYPEPTCLADVHSYLGLTGYFRKYIPSYAKVAKPLSDLLKGKREFRFGPEQRAAFVELKSLLSREPVLAIFNPQCETELHTDASALGYGAVLLQRSSLDGQLHPVYYMSKKTTPQEEKYCSYELEVLAVVTALKKFRVYLLGIKFKLVTDCSALQKTMEKKDLTPRVARWAMLMEEFEYEIEHRSGSRIPHADALSRHPQVLFAIDDGVIARLRRAQQADEGLKAIQDHLQHEPYRDFTMQDGILFKFSDGRETLVVPRSMQHEVVRSAHEEGHYAAQRTEEKLKQDYYIPDMKKVIEKVIRNCVKCMLVNRKMGKQEGLLHPLFKESSPLHTYHVDHIGPLESTHKGYKHIFAVVDSFTKFIWLYPVKSTTSREVIAKLEVQKAVFGNPAQVVSDRGTAFTSNEFEEYCRAENIVHSLITTGLPRANGQVERMNLTIASILAKLSFEDPSRWYKHVDAVQRAMNSTFSRSIGRTPFELLMGVKMRNPADLRIAEIIAEEAVDEFDAKRDEIREAAKEQISKVQEENKRSFDRRRRPARRYAIGDIVAIKRTQMAPGLKLRSKFVGPYRIIKVKLNDTYDVIREGVHVGPNRTTTCAEFMKPWGDDGDSSSEADEPQDGRMWESEATFKGFAREEADGARERLRVLEEILEGRSGGS